MLSLNDVLELKKVRRLMLNSKDKILKKKNSEIESRLFGKTRYYVIAVGTRSLANDNDVAKVRAYVYYNGYICFYSAQGRAYNQQEYIKYIDFVKQGVDNQRYQWTDFWINKGQVISRDKSGNIYVDAEIVKRFSAKTKIAGNISEYSLNLFYEFLRTINQYDENKLIALEDSYIKGTLKDKIERRVKSNSVKSLDEKDSEIIIRTKIEGYNYIISYVKSILKSNVSNKFDVINAFFNRVFFLEMYSYITNDEE